MKKTHFVACNVCGEQTPCGEDAWRRLQADNGAGYVYPTCCKCGDCGGCEWCCNEECEWCDYCEGIK